jgi:hypothetical protein
MKSLMDVADELTEFAEIGIYFRRGWSGKIDVWYRGRSEAAYNAARDFRDENVTAMQFITRVIQADGWVESWMLKNMDFMKHRVERGDYGVAPGLRVIRRPVRVKS